MARRYQIDGVKLTEKMHWHRGIDLTTSKRVWLKFRPDASEEWQNAVHIHEALQENRHICRWVQHERTNTLYDCLSSLLDVIHDDQGTLPPCSIYDAGDCTLAETLAPGRLTVHRQRSILRKVYLLPCASSLETCLGVRSPKRSSRCIAKGLFMETSIQPTSSGSRQILPGS